VNVDVVAVGKVVVDNEVDALEVHAATHDIRADENPDVTGPKLSNHCVALATETQHSN